MATTTTTLPSTDGVREPGSPGPGRPFRLAAQPAGRPDAAADAGRGGGPAAPARARLAAAPAGRRRRHRPGGPSSRHPLGPARNRQDHAGARDRPRPRAEVRRTLRHHRRRQGRPPGDGRGADRPRPVKTTTVLFLDEIHRFNKAQQDALLPGVENRWVVLVAATTENPSFSVVSPLLSRSLLLTLKPLTDADIERPAAAGRRDDRGPERQGRAQRRGAGAPRPAVRRGRPPGADRAGGRGRGGLRRRGDADADRRRDR